MTANIIFNIHNTHHLFYSASPRTRERSAESVDSNPDVLVVLGLVLCVMYSAVVQWLEHCTVSLHIRVQISLLLVFCFGVSPR